MSHGSHQIIHEASDSTSVCLWAKDLPVIEVTLDGADAVDVSLASLRDTVRYRFDLVDDEAIEATTQVNEYLLTPGDAHSGSWVVDFTNEPFQRIRLVDPAGTFVLVLTIVEGTFMCYLKEMIGAGRVFSRHTDLRELTARGFSPLFTSTIPPLQSKVA